jgi:hypothetical protein
VHAVLLLRGIARDTRSLARAAHPNGSLNEAPCPPFTSHSASIRQPFGGPSHPSPVGGGGGCQLRPQWRLRSASVGGRCPGRREAALRGRWLLPALPASVAPQYFCDKNRRYIGKSQSKRPPKRTQRTPHPCCPRRSAHATRSRQRRRKGRTATWSLPAGSARQRSSAHSARESESVRPPPTPCGRASTRLSSAGDINSSTAAATTPPPPPWPAVAAGGGLAV